MAASNDPVAKSASDFCGPTCRSPLFKKHMGSAWHAPARHRVGLIVVHETTH